MDHSCGFRRAYTNRDLRITKLLNKEKPGFLHSQRIWWRTRGGKIESWIQVNTYGGGWQTRRKHISGTPLKELDGGGSSPRIMEARKTRQSEVKRADLLWQVAQGRRCPNRPPDRPPPDILSPSGTTR